MANVKFDPYAEFGGAKPGSAIPVINTQEPTSQQLGFSGLKRSGLEAQPASVGTIAPPPAITSQVAANGHGGGHGGGHSQSHSGESLGVFGTLKAIGKGIVSPITNMLSSPEAFLTGALVIGGCIALEIATAGAITPLLIAGGAVLGGKQVYDGYNEYGEAETAEEKAEAIEHMAAGGTAIALSGMAANARYGGKGIGSGIKNLGKAVREIPSAVVESTDILTSQTALDNLGAVYDNADNLAQVGSGLKVKDNNATTSTPSRRVGRGAPRPKGTPKPPPKQPYHTRKMAEFTKANAERAAEAKKLTSTQLAEWQKYLDDNFAWDGGSAAADAKFPPTPKFVEDNPILSYEHRLRINKYKKGLDFIDQYQHVDSRADFNGSFANALGISSEFTA